MDMWHVSSQVTRWSCGIVCVHFLPGLLPVPHTSKLCHQTGFTGLQPFDFQPCLGCGRPVPLYLHMLTKLIVALVVTKDYTGQDNFKERTRWQQLGLPWWYAMFLPSPALIYTAADQSLHYIVTEMCNADRHADGHVTVVGHMPAITVIINPPHVRVAN